MTSIPATNRKQIEDVFVGRQPIFDTKMDTHAYELLFRSSDANRADFEDGELATAELMLNAFAEIGLNRIVGDYPAFVNVTEEFILSGNCEALPSNRVVIEVLEHVTPSPEVVRSVKRLKDQGYKIALDDFVMAPELMPLVELADIIKVDLPLLDSNELSQHVELLRRHDLKLLAEKVETQDVYERCLQLGFDYFQGYLFCKPTVVKGKRLSGNRLAAMNLISKLQKPNVAIEEVADAIQTDPSLAVKLFRYVNSAYCGLEHKIDSIHHAITLVGLRQVKTICSLSALVSATSNKPEELVRTVLVRAKTAENLAIEIGHTDTERYFIAGLFSALDALLDLPMEQAILNVPISEEIRQAIIEGSGDVGKVLNCVLAYEAGDWRRACDEPFDCVTVSNAYLDAVSWMIQSLMNQ